MVQHADIDHTGITGVGGAALQSARYVRSAGEYTTTSTSFVDVDGTNMVFTFTTGARRVLLGFAGTASNSGTNGYTMFDVTVDGTRQGGDFGLVVNRVNTAGHHIDASFTYLTDVLSAASHTFKLQWRTVAGTSTLHGGSASFARCEFYAVELYA